MSTHDKQRVEVAEHLIGMAIGQPRGAQALIEHGQASEFPPELRPVAEAIFELHRVGQDPTLSTVLAELQRRGQTSYTGDYLGGLAAARAINPAYCRAEIQRMQDHEAAGLLAKTGASVSERLAGDGLRDGLLAEVRQDLLAAVDGSSTSSADSSVDAFDAAQQALHRMERAAAGETDPVLPHGIPELRRFVRGLAPGRLYVVAGRTSNGKSLLAVEMLRHATSHHLDHLGRRAFGVAVSLEMDGEEIYRRMLAAELHTPAHWFDNPADCFTFEGWQRVRAHIQDRSKRINMRIAGSAGQPGRKIRSMSQIESLARIEHRRDKCDILLIDHVGLVTGPERDMRLRVKDTAERAKALAEDLRIPVILVAQLNREGAKDNAPPTLFQMAESSAIEQSADTALLIHRPDRWSTRSDMQAVWADRTGGATEFIPGIEDLSVDVAKNRGGATGEVSLGIDLPCYRVGSDPAALASSRARAPKPGECMGRQTLPDQDMGSTLRPVRATKDIPTEPVQ